MCECKLQTRVTADAERLLLKLFFGCQNTASQCPSGCDAVTPGAVTLGTSSRVRSRFRVPPGACLPPAVPALSSSASRLELRVPGCYLSCVFDMLASPPNLLFLSSCACGSGAHTGTSESFLFPVMSLMVTVLHKMSFPTSTLGQCFGKLYSDITYLSFTHPQFLVASCATEGSSISPVWLYPVRWRVLAFSPHGYIWCHGGF